MVDFVDLNGTGINASNPLVGEIATAVRLEWRITFVILRVIAIFTNLAFVIAVYADRTSKAGPRLFIGNLAFSGLFLCVGLFPIQSVQEWMPSGFITSPCAIVSVAFFFVTAVSWADVCLAVNRTIAICFPFYYDTFRRRTVTGVLIVLSWSLSATIAILVASETGVDFVLLDKSYCTLKVISNFGKFYTGLSTLLPYVLVGMASICIFVTAYVKLHHRRTDLVAGARIRRLLNRRLVIAKAMVVSLFWSMICTLPPLVLISVPEPANVVWTNSWLNNLVTAFIPLLYGVNPIIYFTISPSYRILLLQATCRRSMTRRLGRVNPNGDNVLEGHHAHQPASGTRTRTLTKTRNTTV